jgi:hypothetical protein
MYKLLDFNNVIILKPWKIFGHYSVAFDNEENKIFIKLLL